MLTTTTGDQDNPGHTPSSPRIRDTAGRFVKSGGPTGGGFTSDVPLPDPEQYYAGNVGPEVRPYRSRPGDLDAIDPSALDLEPVAKWAGQPQSGGMGGSVSTSDDAKYDPLKKPGSFAEVGDSGLAQYGGFVRDEFLPQLQGNNARKVWREMYDNDPVVGALVFAVQMLVRKVEWRVEPPEAGSVEQIVEERIQERQRGVMERQQADTQRMMEQQAGVASGLGSPTRQGPGGEMPGAPGGGAPRPSMVGSPLAAGPGMHQPNPTPGAPTAPGSNAPATPDGAGTNPSGGVAQADALGGEGGLPGGGKPTKAQTPFGKALALFTRSRARERMRKSNGTMVGGIAMGDPNDMPVDPETGEAMEFATGEGLNDTSPMARQGEELAVMVETALHDMADSWSDTLSQIITMIVFGFAYHEIVYKKRNGPNPDYPDQGSRFNDGKIGWAKLAGRAQETLHRWEFGDNGEVLGFWQLAPPKFQLKYIPLSKALLFRTSAYKNNPEGRALGLETPVPTPNGWKLMRDLDVGDPVFDEAGRIRYITATATWDDRPVYKITFNDGSSIVADAAHEWVTTTVATRSSPQIRSTEMIARTAKNSEGVTNHAVAWAQAVQYPRQHLAVAPYVLGLWLGDGVSLTGQIAGHVDDAEETARLLEVEDYLVKTSPNGPGLGVIHQVYGLVTQLRSMGLVGDKHVPEQYLRGDIEQRSALLAGLMDSDGTIDADGRCEFTNTNINLVEATAELVRSLGVGARISLRKRADGISHLQDSWAVKFTPPINVFRLSRKSARVKSVRARKNHYMVSVEPIGTMTTKCIEVDSPSHLYLAGTAFVPTHNSILRSAYRPWFFKKRIEEYEAIGVERDLAGLPVAYVPYQWMSASATQEERAALGAIKTLVRNLRRNEQEGVVFPMQYEPETNNKLFELTLLASASKREFDTDKIITRYEQRIAMNALADFILLGHDSVGARSLGETKVDLFTTALEAWLNAIADVFNTYAIPRLMQMNGEDPSMSPKLTFGKIGTIPLSDVAAIITALSSAGATLFPDTPLEDHIRESAGFPPKAASADL